MSGVRSKLTSNFEKSGRKGGRREKKRERGKKKRRPTRQSADNTRRYTGRRGGRAYRRLSGQRKLIARGPSDAFFFFFTIHHRNQLKYLGNAAWRQIRAINGGRGEGEREEASIVEGVDDLGHRYIPVRRENKGEGNCNLSTTLLATSGVGDRSKV